MKTRDYGQTGAGVDLYEEHRDSLLLRGVKIRGFYELDEATRREWDECAAELADEEQ